MMLKPVQDWDLTTLTAVFMARSLKAKLSEMSGGWRGRGESDFAGTVCRCKVLVDDKVISEEDLHSKFASTFAGVGSSGVDALQAVLSAIDADQPMLDAVLFELFRHHD